MSGVRARLASSRPLAAAYAAALAQLPDDITRLQGRVSGITIFPVKGFGGIRVASARVEHRGLVDEATGLADRGVMLAALDSSEPGQDGLALSNRLDGTMSLARVRVVGDSLAFEAPGVDPLRLPFSAFAPRDGPTVRVRVHEGGPIVEAVSEDGELAKWTRSLLRAHPRRRRFDPDSVVALFPEPSFERRVGDRHRAGQDAETLFGDGGQVLVASSSTLGWMNAAIAPRQIEMDAFRPNVVVDGWPANAEDVIHEATLGDAAFVFASLCVRCDATRVDVNTGEKPDREPLAFLAKERPSRDDSPNSATFAINAVARASARGRVIRVGDPVQVLGERSA